MRSNIWNKNKLIAILLFLIFFNSIIINVKGSEEQTTTITATEVSTITEPSITFDSEVKVNDQTIGKYRTETKFTDSTGYTVEGVTAGSLALTVINVDATKAQVNIGRRISIDQNDQLWINRGSWTKNSGTGVSESYSVVNIQDTGQYSLLINPYGQFVSSSGYLFNPFPQSSSALKIFVANPNNWIQRIKLDGDNFFEGNTRQTWNYQFYNISSYQFETITDTALLDEYSIEVTGNKLEVFMEISNFLERNLFDVSLPKQPIVDLYTYSMIVEYHENGLLKGAELKTTHDAGDSGKMVMEYTFNAGGQLGGNTPGFDLITIFSMLSVVTIPLIILRRRKS
ncbi:MAG: hypothetical protein HeimC3_21610 [Candidatus Heimdallarchaeota archaeon LC_3]|nr:MAG: hypothetical protein HeimC3_21610 [Candidatus Heimdallarchaeota archaeon LC_3]